MVKVRKNEMKRERQTWKNLEQTMCHFNVATSNWLRGKSSSAEFVSRQNTTEYDMCDNTHSFFLIFSNKQWTTKFYLIHSIQITNANYNLIINITYDIVTYTTYSSHLYLIALLTIKRGFIFCE